MEKLTEQQRAGAMKMSDERLRAKLQEAGYQLEVLAQFDRQTLLATWAEYLIKQPDPRVLTEEETKAERMEAQASDRILEERRLQLEKRRLEMQERRWRSEMETREKERELREKREEKELEMKEKERELREKKLEVKRVVAENEEKHKESPAYKLKLWGYALRNTIGRMPNEPVEIVSWFISLDRLYVQLGVPNDLRAILLRPYLNERAKTC